MQEYRDCKTCKWAGFEERHGKTSRICSNKRSKFFRNLILTADYMPCWARKNEIKRDDAVTLNGRDYWVICVAPGMAMIGASKGTAHPDDFWVSTALLHHSSKAPAVNDNTEQMSFFNNCE